MAACLVVSCLVNFPGRTRSSSHLLRSRYVGSNHVCVHPKDPVTHQPSSTHLNQVKLPTYLPRQLASTRTYPTRSTYLGTYLGRQASRNPSKAAPMIQVVSPNAEKRRAGQWERSGWRNRRANIIARQTSAAPCLPTSLHFLACRVSRAPAGRGVRHAEYSEPPPRSAPSRCGPAAPPLRDHRRPPSPCGRPIFLGLCIYVLSYTRSFITEDVRTFEADALPGRKRPEIEPPLGGDGQMDNPNNNYLPTWCLAIDYPRLSRGGTGLAFVEVGGAADANRPAGERPGWADDPAL